MDLATREANELLLKAKRALECRQHEARMLVATEEFSQAREDVRKSLDETKSIRDWLGYETEENKETNKDVKKRLLDIETSLREIKMEKSKTKAESVAPSTKKMETDIKTLSAQLDELRNKWGALKNETSKRLKRRTKLSTNKNLPKQLSANESARDPIVQIDLHEQLQPLQKKNGGNVISEDNEDKEPRHRQRRKRNLERLAEAHKNSQIPNPHTQKRLRITNPTESPLIVSSKDKTHKENTSFK
ncbi:hypothetical protein EVAR_77674_1 [Eumeta japonica]|uniref:Uncharacterized protein n=1 Tax=Eumeta variegata TaxID=151549 RepID=A0A4C2AC23_EUMVA|nr:hypothetical protein EVAR_77674_1 [Eumeta japonica]